MLTTIFNQLMEKQQDYYINGYNSSRDSERVSSRNGYYNRNYTTRVGRMELAVPRTRDGEFSPFIFSDVLLIKVHESGKEISNAFHDVLGINDIGEIQVLSFSVSDTESYDTWKQLYINLIERGLKGLKLVI